jgi:NADH:ubiquinone oxidoreductase subunit K
MIFVSALLMGIGFIGFLRKSTLLGLLVSTQLMTGAVALLVLAGVKGEAARVPAEIFAAFVIFSGTLLAAVMLSSALRLFVLRGNAEIKNLDQLKG